MILILIVFGPSMDGPGDVAQGFILYEHDLPVD